jgi:hypothetical protein
MAKAVEYSPELATEICELVANSERGLRSVLQSDDRFPSPAEWWRWTQNNAQLSGQYASAKRRQIEMMAEDIVDLSMDDKMDPNDKRIRIDTRKWLLSKLMAKTYGDKLDLTSGGEALAAPSHVVDQRIQSIIMMARLRKQGVIDADAALDAKALKLLD